jgi:uncharacterized protein (AIM24 family)
MVIYTVQSNGACNQLVIELINDAVLVDAQTVAYVTGNIDLEASDNTFGTKFKSYFIGASVFKPTFRGTGKIYLNATLGSYHKFSLKNNEELLINPKVFIACRNSIEVKPQLNFSLKNFLTGVPLLSMYFKGTGSIMVVMPGPVQECALKEDKFVAIASEVAAYNTTLKVSREIVGKNWLGDQKMAKVYRGTGSVFFSPIPNKDSRSRINKE